uniref:hypothetical protein n=1 Tax=Methylophaga sp. TaxID=2024840 RepID=UPI003F69E91B
QIENALPKADKNLVHSLQDELELVCQNKITQQATQTHHPEIDINSGCYRFDGDPNFYCPQCFDQRQQRIPTQRINRQLHVCTQCRSSLKPAKK